MPVRRTRIRELRRARGLTQPQLAKLLDVTHPTVQRWESPPEGQEPEWISRVWDLSKALRCHPGEIFADLGGGPSLDPEEIELLDAYRQIRASDRHVIVGLLKGLAKKPWESFTFRVRDKRSAADDDPADV